MDLNAVRAVSAPRTRAELLPLAGGDAVLGGGTWLFSRPHPRVHRLVDLTGLGWPAVTIDDDGLELAATCTVEEVSGLSRRLPELRPDWAAAPLLHRCCTALLASFKIWRTATVGGNLCLGLPAGAMISLTAALAGRVLLWSPDGTDRELAVDDFVTGEARTALAPGEVLRSVRMPAAALRGTTAFRKLAPSPKGRSGIVVIGRRDPAGPNGPGGFTLAVSAATVRPYTFAFPDPPSAAEVRDAVTGVDDRAWTDDPHGDPDWRAAMAALLAEDVRAELT